MMKIFNHNKAIGDYMTFQKAPISNDIEQSQGNFTYIF